MRVLFLNHPFIECGVYQFGERVYDPMSKSEKFNSFYKEVCNREEYLHIIDWIKPMYIVYNYHWDRMPWLTGQDISGNKSTKHYFIYHDGSMFNYYDKYLFFGDFDPERKAVPENKRVLLPRPLLNYNGSYPKNKITTIGSFGFAFNHKRYHNLVRLINKTFKEAVINLHIPNPYFGDTPKNKIKNIIANCKRNNTNPKVKLNISTNFLSNDDLLTFLAGNDINVFYYEHLDNPGLSSAIDYALSVKRPIAITNNIMFRHIVSNEILMEKNSIKSILDRGTNPLQRYYDAWSQENLTIAMENLFL